MADPICLSHECEHLRPDLRPVTLERGGPYGSYNVIRYGGGSVQLTDRELDQVLLCAADQLNHVRWHRAKGLLPPAREREIWPDFEHAGVRVRTVFVNRGGEETVTSVAVRARGTNAETEVHLLSNQVTRLLCRHVSSKTLPASS